MTTRRATLVLPTRPHPIRLGSMHSTYNRVAGQSVERLAALSDGIFAAPAHLSDERDDARHFLGRPADAAELFRPRRPQRGLDSYRVSVRRVFDPVLDVAAGRVHSLPHSAAGLLVQYLPARRVALLELELRHAKSPPRK